MSGKHSIAPFPADIDRDIFGHWLSGFTDGEGYFGLYWHRNHHGRVPLPKARFAIGLRADDRPVLELIRSFFGCGAVCKRANLQNPAWNPSVDFGVQDYPSFNKIIIPHFERFPLRAKKARDFLLWKQGVSLLGGGPGVPHDTSKDAAFEAVRIALKSQRLFQAPSCVTPVMPAPEPTLFDDL